MKQIFLTQGKVTLVDDADFNFLNQFKWYAAKDRNTFYAIRSNYSNGKHTILMHHLIVGKPPKGMTTDHLDGNGLNNQRSNLKIKTNRQNQQNRKEHRDGKLPGTKFDKRAKNKPWSARIQINGQT